MEACVNWFRQHEHAALQILLFNTSGDRDCAALLRLLMPERFDYALFCPNVSETSSAQPSLSVCAQQMLNQNIWDRLKREENKQRPLALESSSLVFPCIHSALQWINRRTHQESISNNVSVLVTGSLYLVGGVLKLLDPAHCS
ncbi:folylpolyglutamate synthase, mitochondrial-like [Gouania willdenowi]|nr:folylpolyglutamate synthase, mitochondrial-like [Gouania willdenowi]